ncbi:unnamed protein product [Urochloa humidicola]
MGNMLPCLIQGSSSSILPPMNTKHWCRSTKILVRTLRRSTKRPHFSNRIKAAASRERSGSDDPAAPRNGRGPRSGGGQNDRRGRAAVRVKVILTRAEAARLLSLTADGHRTAAQVAGELKRMQTANRSSRASTAQVINELKRMEELVVSRASISPSASTTAWQPVLESIPEEWQ